MQKVLLTGFDPFNKEKVNPSIEAVKQLNNQIISDYLVIAKEIPTVFGKSIPYLDQLIQEVEPSVVICVGQAGGRAHISVERIAINIADAIIADNEANQLYGNIVRSGNHNFSTDFSG